jgi:hypothetical protein
MKLAYICILLLLTSHAFSLPEERPKVAFSDFGVMRGSFPDAMKNRAILSINLLQSYIEDGGAVAVYDRTVLNELFTEKGTFLLEEDIHNKTEVIRKIPLVDYIFTFEILEVKGKSLLLIQLASSGSAMIISQRLIDLNSVDLDKDIAEQYNLILSDIIDAKTIEDKLTVSIGSFFPLGTNEINGVIEYYFKKKALSNGNVNLLQRRNMLPFIQEGILSYFQSDSKKLDAIDEEISIYGGYKWDEKKGYALYVYVDNPETDRVLLTYRGESIELLVAMAYKEINNRLGFRKISEFNRRQSDLVLTTVAGKLLDIQWIEKILVDGGNGHRSLMAYFTELHLEDEGGLLGVLDLSTSLNPNNDLAHLLKLMLLWKKENHPEFIDGMMSIYTNPNNKYSKVAYQLVREDYIQKGRRFDKKIINEISGGDKTIYDCLINADYLSTQEYPNDPLKLSDSLLKLYTGILGENFCEDEGNRVQEYLRVGSVSNEYPIRTVYGPRYKSSQKRQVLDSQGSSYGRNSNRFFNIAVSLGVAEIHFKNPRSLFVYDEKSELRRSNKFPGFVDMLLASIYLNNSNLDAKALVVKSACLNDIKRCKYMKPIAYQTVENERKTKLKGRGGVYHNITDQILVRDGLIDIIAREVNMLNSAPFSELWRDELIRIGDLKKDDTNNILADNKVQVNEDISSNVLLVNPDTEFVEVLKKESITNAADKIKHINKNYHLDPLTGHYYKGYFRKSAIGPVLDEYFSADLWGAHEISEIKEKLFLEGVIGPKGFLKINKNNLNKKIQEIFVDMNSRQISGVKYALTSSLKVKGAGYLEILNHNGIKTKLSPLDSNRDQMFGLAFDVDRNKALVCDYQDAVYFFEMGESWRQKLKISERCKNIAMKNDYAVIVGDMELSLYQFNGVGWDVVQRIRPQADLESRDRKHKFEDFGNSISLSEKYLAVFNQGALQSKQVYVYRLDSNILKNIAIIEMPKGSNWSGLGEALLISSGTLYIADSSAKCEESKEAACGAIYSYTLNGENVSFKKKLIPELRKRIDSFGSEIVDLGGDGIYMKSRSNSYIHTASKSL